MFSRHFCNLSNTGRILTATVVIALAADAAAYLASPVELRSFWDRDRTVRQPLYLKYGAQSDSQQTLEIYIRPNGLWAKRVQIGDRTRTEWSYGLDRWIVEGGRIKKAERRLPQWDDWVFDPKIDVLLEITPRNQMRTRGLGRHEEGYMWLYGAHHDNATNHWFGLLREPIRPGVWRSANPRVGVVHFRYDGRHQYPDEISFQREDQSDFVLQKEMVLWNREADAKLVTPDNIVIDPSRMPQRMELSVTETTRY